MRDLHESVRHTAREVTIKENKDFRLRLEKWECLQPKGLFAVNIIHETFDKDGEICNVSTYKFNMTQEELKKFGDCLTV